MRDARQLATRYAGRPILMLPEAALSYAERIRSADPRAFQRPRGFDAMLQKLRGSASAARQPIGAMEDDEDFVPRPFGERLAYSPRWLGEAEDYGFCWSLHQGVALIRCDTALVERGDEWCGEVYHGYDTLLVSMQEATSDERVKAVMLCLDSPGGVVGGGLQTLAKWIRENRASAGGKPIWVYADMACSAAYWIAAQADRIVAPSVGIVGSIGAVLVHENWAEALGKAGVEITSLEFPEGALKTEGAWWKALTDEGKANLLDDVAQVGRDFIGDVVAGRPTFTAEALLATRADAFMALHDDPARSGQALGFVDGIGSEQDCFAALVAEISAPAVLTPSPAAPVSGPAPAAATTETPMRSQPKASKAERIAAVQASTDSEKLEKIQQILDEPDDEAEPEDPPAEDPPAAETPAAEGDASQTEAQKITGSAEAKAHPQLALAAVNTGQTFAQFKASVAAAAQARGGARALPGAMQNARRLGPDAAAPGAGKGQVSALARRAEERKAQRQA